jgi:hypothetical protein
MVIGWIIIGWIGASWHTDPVPIRVHGRVHGFDFMEWVNSGHVFQFMEWNTSGLDWLSLLLLDLIAVIGLWKRSGWAWWLTVGYWSLRSLPPVNWLYQVLDDPNRPIGVGPDPGLLMAGLFALACTAFPVVVLIISRGRGRYLLQLAGDARPTAAERQKALATPRRSCQTCGGRCPDVDNNWTRAGRCSKKCMENDGRR